MSLPAENRTVRGYKFVVCSLVLWREDLAPGLQCLWCVLCFFFFFFTPPLLLFPIKSIVLSLLCVLVVLISEPKLSTVEGL